MEPAQKQRAFTLIELLVTIAVISILIAILSSAVGSAKRAARAAQCGSNMRQVGLAVLLYVGDHQTFPSHIPQSGEGVLPGLWFMRIRKYTHGSDQRFMNAIPLDRLFMCTEEKRRVGLVDIGMGITPLSNIEVTPFISYNATGAAYHGTPLADARGRYGLGRGCRDGGVSVPVLMVGLACGPRSFALGREATPYYVGAPHREKANVFFVDGHVERVVKQSLTARDDNARASWNKDNQPHVEIWAD